jgi:hypothetical protein
MKTWGTLVLGIAVGTAVACGSSDDQPPGGATGGKGGKSGAGGKGGSSAGQGGDGATGGSNGARAGKSSGGSAGRGGTSATGGSSARAGRGGTGNAATGGTGGNGDAGSEQTGGTTSVGGTGGVSGMTAVGGTTAMGGESGDTGASGASGASGDGSGGAAQLTLNVHTSSNVHAISPLIYGVTPFDGSCSVPAAARFTLCRLGEDRWSSYDWENNASNTGSHADDACFVNDGELGGGDTAGAAVSDAVAQAQTAGVATLVTLPNHDNVAADKPGGVGVPYCCVL